MIELSERDKVLIKAAIDGASSNGDQRISVRAPDIIIKSAPPAKIDVQPIADAILSLESADRFLPVIETMLSTRIEPATLVSLLEAIREQSIILREQGELTAKLILDQEASIRRLIASNNELVSGFSTILSAFTKMQENTCAPRKPIALEIEYADGTKSYVTG